MIELWRAVGYDPASRAHTLTGAGTSAVHKKGEVTLSAPLDDAPMLLRPGTVLCLLSPAVDTLAPYGESVRRADDISDRVVLAFPSASWSGPLGPGLSAKSVVTDTAWTLEVAKVNDRRLGLEVDLGLLPGGAPDNVDVRGAAASHHYDRSTGVLRAELTGNQLEVSRVGSAHSA